MSGVVERLYVYWIASTILLVFVSVVPALLLRGAAERQAARIAALEQRLGLLESRPAEAERAPPPAPLEKSASVSDSGPRAERLSSEARRDEAPASPPATPPQPQPERNPAVLRDRADSAARAALAAGRAEDALTAAERLAELTDDSATSGVLLAAASLAMERPAAADEILVSLPEIDSLSTADRILLGRLCVALERYESLGSILATLEAPTADLESARDFLSAIDLVQRNRTTEALAVLDFLAETAGREPARSVLAPTVYEIGLWRGVALHTAGQPDAARQALRAAAERDPAQPETHYRLGLIELAAGHMESARGWFEHALATSARFAPAWETLAAIDLNAGDVPAALQKLARAVELNARRASAHFLTAIAQAKLGQRDAAEQALRAALRLRPELLSEARQSDVLVRLIPPAEMETFVFENGEKADGAESRPSRQREE
jgi:tetratricopeptide (TPR) repeat protein